MMKDVEQGDYPYEYYSTEVKRENQLLREQLGEALRANEELNLQMEEVRRGPGR